MGAEMAVPSTSPQIAPITQDDVYAALAEGWRDFRATPAFGLFFGGAYALGGIALFIELWRMEQPLWILPLALAFPLVGPFVAVGLYEVSRRRELGLPPDWAAVLGVVWRERGRQIPWIALVVLGGFMLWLWAARLIIAIFIGRIQFAVYSDLDAILSTNAGLMMLFFGAVVGAAIAFAMFTLTVVAIPMLLDRDVDFVTAMMISTQAVQRNTPAMLTWAIMVAGSLLAAMVPLFLGLAVVLPVLGHATWHLYRRVIRPAGWRPEA